MSAKSQIEPMMSIDKDGGDNYEDVRIIVKMLITKMTKITEIEEDEK